MKRYFVSVFIISALLITASVLLLIYTVTSSVLADSALVSDSPHSVVIIDAGHGGADSGAVGPDGTLEKDLNLSIALKLKEYLEENNTSVILTRKNDDSIHDGDSSTLREKKVSDIHNRMKIMEDTDNCIFVSIHQNSFGQSKYKGTQVFYSPNTDSSVLLAQSIQKSVVNQIQNDNKREIKKCTDSVYLIYNAKKTAVLVECGFMTNSDELALLKSEEYQTELSKAIGDGIIDYLKKEV